MFHNEWSAQAAKPLQHTIGTETKLQFGMVWDRKWKRKRKRADTDRRSFGNGRCQDPSGAICDQRRPGSPPNAKARRPESKFRKEPEAP
jgi:hypothetical protein